MFDFLIKLLLASLAAFGLYVACMVFFPSTHNTAFTVMNYNVEWMYLLIGGVFGIGMGFRLAWD